MKLTANLFVHGVPLGQKIWGPKEYDQQYLSSFYSQKWNIPEFMMIEVITFGEVTNCYYSFVKGLNICDMNGRTGSYFALTLRINAFYADVQNMYNVLKAAYDKMCVGLCIQETETMSRFLLEDFQKIDPELKNIENHIVDYIRKFSIYEDIVPLSGFVANSSGTSLNINLHECTKSTALDYIKKQRHINVSPYFPSSGTTETINKYKTEIETIKQKAEQEIHLQQENAQKQIAAITQEKEKELRLSEECSHKQMQQLKQSYSGIDKERDTFKREKERLTEDVDRWKKRFQEKEKENEALKRLIPDKPHGEKPFLTKLRLIKHIIETKTAVILLISLISLIIVLILCVIIILIYQNFQNPII